MDRITCDTLNDPQESNSFRDAFHDNVLLVLDMLQTMSEAAAHVGDQNTARFLTGLGAALASFSESSLTPEEAEIAPLRRR